LTKTGGILLDPLRIALSSSFSLPSPFPTQPRLFLFHIPWVPSGIPTPGDSQPSFDRKPGYDYTTFDLASLLKVILLMPSRLP
jgi:hypothetical protein